MRHIRLAVIAAALGALLLTGCYDEGPTVAIHKPGQYKGETDPFVAKSASAQQDEILANRFRKVQTDR